jgi:hypothetical protein
VSIFTTLQFTITSPRIYLRTTGTQYKFVSVSLLISPKIGEVVVCYCLYFFTRRKCPGTEHRLTFFGAFFAIQMYHIGKYYKVQHAFIAKTFNIVLIKGTYIYLYSKKNNNYPACATLALSPKKVSRCSVPGH